MSWFFVDDSLSSNPKLGFIPDRMKLKAMGLWVLAGSWSRLTLSGGHVPSGQVRLLGGTKPVAEALVTAGLWERTSTGYYFHDWSDYQETLEELEAKRSRARAKKAAWRKRRADRTVRSGQAASVDGESNGDSKRVSRPCPAPVPHFSPERDLSPSPSPSPRENSDHVIAAPITARLVRGTGPKSENGGGGFERRDQAESGLVAKVRSVLAERFAGVVCPDGVADRLASWAAEHHPTSPAAVCEQLADTFYRDPWAAENGWPLLDLAKRPGRYLSPSALLEAKQRDADDALAAGDVEKWRSARAEITRIRQMVNRNGGGHGTR